MIFIWVIAYGCVYILAETLSKQIGVAHSVTAFAILLYAAALVWWSQKKEKKLSLSYKLEGKAGDFVYPLPLLCFPLSNLLTVENRPNMYAYLLTIGVCVVEEIFFRGYLPAVCKEKKWGAILSSVAFALFHFVNATSFNGYLVAQVLSAFAVGLCFCGLTEKYQSLLPSTLLHLSINLTGVGIPARGWYVGVGVCGLVYLVYGILLTFRRKI